MVRKPIFAAYPLRGFLYWFKERGLAGFLRMKALTVDMLFPGLVAGVDGPGIR